MTNAEKFVEVFGTELKRHYAIKSWWEQEFVPANTGHWIECEDEVKVYCSECKEKSDYPTNYCPNCGAKMSENPTGSESEGV